MYFFGHIVTLNKTEEGKNRYFGRQIMGYDQCLAHSELLLEKFSLLLLGMMR